MAARWIGMKKPIGSMGSNRTQLCGRVKRQFMVKVKGAQSVSMIPPRGAMPSFIRLGEPPSHRFQPSGVLNSPSTWKVSTPSPNSDTGRRAGSTSVSSRIVTASWLLEPSQIASKPQGLRISHPWAFAMFSGRQR